MADDVKKLDPETLFCATPGCDFTAKRGTVLRGCVKCSGKAFVDNLRKADIEAAQPKKAAPLAKAV